MCAIQNSLYDFAMNPFYDDEMKQKQKFEESEESDGSEENILSVSSDEDKPTKKPFVIVDVIHL